MPLHDFECPAGHVFEAYVPAGTETAPCPTHNGCSTECAASHIPGYEVLHAGLLGHKVFLRAPMGLVQPDICYDSPIDGRPITSKQARIEDLARADCVPYEEGIRQDQDRKKRESEESLEKAVDQTVEKEIALMPARKRERLTAELEGGLTAEPARVTPQQVSFRDA